MSVPRFTPRTLTFLRQLKRHNNRDWFRMHRNDYETHVWQPMVDLVEHLSVDLRTLAPDLVASPQKSIYRIYRDTRFSANKEPFKTQVAAIFPHRNLPKHQGAGLYVHVSAEQVFIGGGLYRPEQRQLYQLREHISTNTQLLTIILNAPSFRRNFGRLSGSRLQRVPRGFDSGHPAAKFLRMKQFLAGTERPSTFATGLRFYSSLLHLFKQLIPFIEFVNKPLTRKRFEM